jgi:hypothetical protein
MINVSNISYPTHAHLTIQRTDIHKNRNMRIKTKKILCAFIAERIPERIAECVGIIMVFLVRRVGNFVADAGCRLGNGKKAVKKGELSAAALKQIPHHLRDLRHP